MNWTSLICIMALLVWEPIGTAGAQTLDSKNFKIEWQVVNRFRMFRDPAFFKMHENAWQQYIIHVDGLRLAEDDRDNFIQHSSVLGSEHVLNDRRIAFTNLLRKNFDWRGWAARGDGNLCYDSEQRKHNACGGIEEYLNPRSHEIELWLTNTNGETLPSFLKCEWRIAGVLATTSECGEHVGGPRIALPYPGGAEISVNVVGEQPIIVSASTRDVLIVGMGDSFASGEGNPNLPVEFGDTARYHNLYPLRRINHAGGSATWTDQLCHRSLYSQQLRAALQIAVENRQLAVTYLDYSCSGAGVDEGILGPQTYVERTADAQVSSATASRPLSGGEKDSQIYRLLREICADKPEYEQGLWRCRDNHFRRTIDYVFLSIGGNDIGFSNIVAWATLRSGVSSSVAEFFGATVSAEEFAARMRDILPDAYARLAKALESTLPVNSANDGIFDPSRIILTAYPDLVTDENGHLCEADTSGGNDEDRFAANQSLDMFSSWLVASEDRLGAVRGQFSQLFQRMRSLAEDHGWTFAGNSYSDKMFEGHGFCARNPKLAGDPAEMLMIPCWGTADRDSQTCQTSWSGKAGEWRPYNPASQNFPYALRQRWVRSFNDAYMVVNQKVVSRSGKIDEKTSASVFSETTGALHPTAEGHAAMADSLLLSARPMIEEMLEEK